MSNSKIEERTATEVIILNVATDLFSKFGIRKVSVEEICRVAELSKMTFYRYFKNKDAIAKAVVEHLLDTVQNDFDAVMDAPVLFPEKVKELIELERKYSSTMSKAFLEDLYQKEQTTLTSKIEESQTKQFERIKLDFEKAQKDGWINPDMSIDFIMYMLNDISLKLQNDDLLLMYTHPSKLILDLVNMFFYGIMSGKNK